MSKLSPQHYEASQPLAAELNKYLEQAGIKEKLDYSYESRAITSTQDVLKALQKKSSNDLKIKKLIEKTEAENQATISGANTSTELETILGTFGSASSESSTTNG